MDQRVEPPAHRATADEPRRAGLGQTPGHVCESHVCGPTTFGQSQRPICASLSLRPRTSLGTGPRNPRNPGPSASRGPHAAVNRGDPPAGQHRRRVCQEISVVGGYSPLARGPIRTVGSLAYCSSGDASPRVDRAASSGPRSWRASGSPSRSGCPRRCSRKCGHRWERPPSASRTARRDHVQCLLQVLLEICRPKRATGT